MEFTATKIPGVWMIAPRIFQDKRGLFFESWCQRKFNDKLGQEVAFVQDNESHSAAGVVRGLHFQRPPHAQGKLVRCTSGAILDVVDDLRKHSPTYGEFLQIELSEENKMQLWIPRGMAHGFSALADNTVIQYKCTDHYAPDHEVTLLWNDADLGIDWSVDSPIVSVKDKQGTPWCQFESPFD